VTTKEAVTAYLDALNAHDADHIAACVTDDFFNEHTSAAGVSVRGRDAYRERLDGFLAQFTDLRYDVEALLVDGDGAAVPYTMRCTWRDDAGVGHPVELRGMFRFVVRCGLIAHRVDYWDADFTRQTTQPVPGMTQ
jgi:steroid delta-isomerase-like uncharacterized protein